MIRIRVHEKLTISTAATRLNISFKNHAFPFVLCYCLLAALLGLASEERGQTGCEGQPRFAEPWSPAGASLGLRTVWTPVCFAQHLKPPLVRDAWRQEQSCRMCVLPRGACSGPGVGGDREGMWRSGGGGGPGAGAQCQKGQHCPSPRVSWGSDFSVHGLISSAPCDPSSSARAAGAQRGSGCQSRAHARPLARAFLLGEIFLGCLFPTRRSIVVGCEEGPAVCSGVLPPVTGQTLCDVRNPLCHFQCILCRPHLHLLTLL